MEGRFRVDTTCSPPAPSATQPNHECMPAQLHTTHRMVSKHDGDFVVGEAGDGALVSEWRAALCNGEEVTTEIKEQT